MMDLSTYQPAADLLRSKGQVAQSLAQAVSDGVRRL